MLDENNGQFVGVENLKISQNAQIQYSDPGVYVFMNSPVMDTIPKCTK